MCVCVCVCVCVNLEIKQNDEIMHVFRGISTRLV